MRLPLVDVLLNSSLISRILFRLQLHQLCGRQLHSPQSNARQLQPHQLPVPQPHLCLLRYPVHFMQETLLNRMLVDFILIGYLISAAYLFVMVSFGIRAKLFLSLMAKPHNGDNPPNDDKSFVRLVMDPNNNGRGPLPQSVHHQDQREDFNDEFIGDEEYAEDLFGGMEGENDISRRNNRGPNRDLSNKD
ncbi:hypothetical protein L3X38_010087 [Prunus dulcis]|uniref:Uncharacterized protein n=1 Tax=Prunus dulcis TaxID=3755 RepID=A0AAD4WHL6_PRUDU|nr:hypothetical protein L3X38_010087 [Prunus dulcis]